jgi:hypothetical protein
MVLKSKPLMRWKNVHKPMTVASKIVGFQEGMISVVYVPLLQECTYIEHALFK